MQAYNLFLSTSNALVVVGTTLMRQADLTLMAPSSYQEPFLRLNATGTSNTANPRKRPALE